jgi:hypothetical protein
LLLNAFHSNIAQARALFFHFCSSVALVVNTQISKYAFARAYSRYKDLNQFTLNCFLIGPDCKYRCNNNIVNQKCSLAHRFFKHNSRHSIFFYNIFLIFIFQSSILNIGWKSRPASCPIIIMTIILCYCIDT